MNDNEKFISGHHVGLRIRAFLDCKVPDNDMHFYVQKLWAYVKKNVPYYTDHNQNFYDSTGLGSVMDEWFEIVYPDLQAKPTKRAAPAKGSKTKSAKKTTSSKGGKNG